MNKKIVFIVLIIIATASLYFIFGASSITPSISVQDQTTNNNEVVVSEVVTADPSWLVIQTNNNGAPGPVVGYTKLNTGSNVNVKTKIDIDKATPSLYAMIHEDTGTKNSFDFPNNDLPLMYKMEMVAKTFNLTK